MFAARWRNCSECKQPFYDRVPPRGIAYCFTCRMKRAEQAAFSMRNKQGAYYDAWCNSRGPQGRPRIR